VPRTLDRILDLVQIDTREEGGAVSSGERDLAHGILNGVVGDHLQHSNNSLAINMGFRQGGRKLPLFAADLAEAVADPKPKILLMVHGLCLTDLQWTRGDHNHGVRLAEALGYTPIYLHYNTGRHISHNGRELAECLDTLMASWPVPVEDLSIVAHSMGGLVSRSALHYSGQSGRQSECSWPSKLRKLIFLGTPHHGAPLERGGNLLDKYIEYSPFTAPFTRLSKIRSAGITDLRYGNLIDEDWHANDRFAHSGDQRQALPLGGDTKYYAVAATKSLQDGAVASSLIGDGLVPTDSAHGEHAEAAFCLNIPAQRKAIFYGVNHMELLGKPEIYRQLHDWLASC
jgi:pimeloyl-ACP methyl ester carboxylesterase